MTYLEKIKLNVGLCTALLVPMSKPILTRYLYFLDEVLRCFVVSTVGKRSFDECVFWLSEVYYSGFQERMIECLWKTYYDFYAVTYPKYESKLVRLMAAWKKSGDLHHLLYVVNMLYHSKPDGLVFYLRMLNPVSPASVYTGRLPKWLKDLGLSKQIRKLVRSIHKDNMTNVAFYLGDFGGCEDSYACYNAVKKYFSAKHDMNLSDVELDAVPYSDKSHIVLALICYLLRDPEDIKKKSVFRKLEKDVATKCISFNGSCPDSAYETLPRKRLYSISGLIGYGPLDRYCVTDDNGASLETDHLMWRHWEYFAYGSPLWKERFDVCGAQENHTKRIMTFPDDDKLDTFYEKYGYEPDEQSREVQDRAARAVEPLQLKEWLAEMNLSCCRKLKDV